MSRIIWDDVTKKLFETGVRQGVMYPQDDDGKYPMGYGWNGLTKVTESPEGAEPTDLYANDTKYLTMRSAENLKGTIEAYTYPDAFAECNGEAELMSGVVVGQQSRKAFGLCYRTVLGNDVALNDYAYKLHILYGCTCSPAEKSYETVNDSPSANTFSWSFSTTPVDTGETNLLKTASITITSKDVDPDNLKILEDYLYGKEGQDPRLLTIPEIKSVLTTGKLPTE